MLNVRILISSQCLWSACHGPSFSNALGLEENAWPPATQDDSEEGGPETNYSHFLAAVILHCG